MSCLLLKKPMVPNTLAQGVIRQSTVWQGMSPMNLRNKQTLNKIAKSPWVKFWSVFTNFGPASAGLIELVTNSIYTHQNPRKSVSE